MTKPAELVSVMGFFALIIVVNAGGFSSYACNCNATHLQTVEVKRGEKVTLLNEKSGLKDVNRLTYEACENRTEIFIYCSTKEMGSGCEPKNSSTFLFQIENNSVSITPLDASELGCYVIEIFGKNVVKKLVVVYEQLSSTSSPESPSFPTSAFLPVGSLETAEAFPIKGNETSWTIRLEDLEVIAVDIALFTVVVLFPVFVVINCICQKTLNNPDAGDGAGNSDVNTTLISTTSGEFGDYTNLTDRAKN